MSYRLPLYTPSKLTKDAAYKRLGKAKEVVDVLGVTLEDYKNWGRFIPPPFADRLILSNWGEKELQPRHVAVEDALIIFKDFKAMAEHFGRKKTWREKELHFLPELESGYMIKHFGRFMRVFTERELKNRHYF